MCLFRGRGSESVKSRSYAHTNASCERVSIVFARAFTNHLNIHESQNVFAVTHGFLRARSFTFVDASARFFFVRVFAFN